MFVEIESNNADATEPASGIAEVIEIDVEFVAEDVRPVNEQPYCRFGRGVRHETCANAVKHGQLPGFSRARK
ncbi:hypothetical protein JCM9743_32690 [Natrinema sp. JCM 9743]